MPIQLNAPALDQRLVYDHYIAARGSAVLTVAVNLGLFDLLEQSPKSSSDIAEAFELSLRGATSIVRALVAMKLLVPDGEAFANSEHASAFLVSTKEGYIGALIAMEFEHFLTPQKVLQAAREDRPTVYGDTDVWSSHAESDSQAKDFTAAMHAISTQPALALSRLPIWRTDDVLVDMGCGSAVYSIALMQLFPQFQAKLCDIPNLEGIVGNYLERYGVADRAQFVGIDMFKAAWPEGTVVLLSQILHDWNPLECRQLLQRAFAALPAGGRIVIHEKLTETESHLPLANALVNLDMLIWTTGQQFSYLELKALLEEVGFSGCQHIPSDGYWSAVVATKSSD